MTGGNERIETRTRADIDHALALREVAKRKRIRDARKRLHRHVRQRPNEFVVIAETLREIAARVEMKISMRVECDFAILVLDLLS